MEKKRKSKIRKWDEVGGIVETEIEESSSEPDEVNGAVLSLSKNPMRSVEDMVEQNDNSLDGVINNMPEPKPAAQMTSEEVIKEEQVKKSILKRLQESAPPMQKSKPVPDCGLCSELERT